MVAKGLVGVGASKLMSDIGQYLDTIVLNVYIFHLTQSATAVGTFMACRVLGAVAPSYFSGILADRGGAKRLMIVADLVRATVLLALIASPQDMHLYLLFPGIFLLGAMRSIFNVAFLSSVPHLVPASMRVRLNASWTAIDSIATIVGAGFAAIALDYLSYTAIFAYDAATYLLSAGAILALNLPRRTAPAEGKTSSAAGVSQLAPLGAVLVAILTIRGLEAFAASANMVAYPVFSALIRQDNPAFVVGVIMMAWGGGKALGALVIDRYSGRFGHTMQAHSTAFVMCVALTLIAFFCIFTTNIVPVVATAAFVAGIFDGAAEVSFTSALQLAPPGQVGRAFGLATTIDRACLGLGMLAAGWMLETESVLSVLACFYALPFLASVVCAARLQKISFNSSKETGR